MPAFHQQFPIYEKYDFLKPLPFLTKQDIAKNFPLNWLTPNTEKRLQSGDVEWLSTSGTTAERMQIFRPKQWRQQQIAKSFAYHSYLNELWQRGTKRVVLTTAVCSQMVCFKNDQDISQRWVDRSLYTNLHADPNQWQHKDVLRMMNEMNAVGEYVLDAAPTYLALFIVKLKQFGLLEKWVRPLCLTLGYELCTHNIYALLNEYISAPIIHIYGATEFGYLLMQEDKQPMECCTENLKLELLAIDAARSLYELVVTTDKNPYMPLLRYRTGDCVDAQITDGELTVHRIMGRVRELLIGKDQQMFAHQHVDDVVHAIASEVFIYQLQQAASDKVFFNYTTFTGKSINEPLSTRLKAALQTFLKTEVMISEQSQISPGHSGKFKWYTKTC